MKWTMVFLVILLAGCGSKGHSLDPYLVESGEAPDACYYADLESDDWEILQLAGLTSNPGSIPDDMVAQYEVERPPKDNRIGIFECKFEDGTHAFVTGAVAFDNKEDADHWLSQEDAIAFFSTDCAGQAAVFRTDTVVGTIASLDQGWHPAIEAARDDALARILDETGARSLC